MISYQDQGFYFSTSSAQATFHNGVTKTLDMITVEPKTPMGDLIVLSSSSTAEQDENPYLIRLVFISPAQDWRTQSKETDYIWKLDNAWMSTSSSSWLHWNVQSFVDSAIRMEGTHNASSSSLFTCDQMEFHFRPLRGGTTDSNSYLTLYNVKIGSHLEEAYQPYRTTVPDL